MPQLTATNIAVLNNYAAAGQRERYWSYLAALGDKYAARALEVVRNDGPFGQLANNHAAAAVPDNRAAEFTEQQWNVFGVKLMQADLDVRRDLFNRNIGDKGLTLSVDTIRTYHAVAFANEGLPKTAWTLEPVIGGMLDSGNASQQLFAQAYWDIAVSGPYGYALAMVWAPSSAVVAGGVWNAITSTLNNGYQFAQYDGRSALRNPDVIRGWSFNATTGEWSKESALSNTAGIPYMLSPTPQELQLLNADRLYRQNRLSDPARFQRDPQDSLTPTGLKGLASLDPANIFDPSETAVASNLAELAMGGSTQASLGGGLSSSVPSSVVDAVREQLAGRDLTRAETYRQGNIVYVDFDNGDRLAIDQQGRIATIKTESVAGVGNRTVSTDFDRNTTTFEQSINGTNTTTQRNALNQVTSSIVATESQIVMQEYTAPDTPGNRTVIDQQTFGTRVQVYDSSNALQSTTNRQIFDDGSSIATTNYPNGTQSILTTATNGTSRTVDTPNPADPRINTTTDRNAAGQVTGSTSTSPVLETDIDSPAFGQPIPGQYLVVTNNAAGQTTGTSILQVNPIDGSTIDTPVTGEVPASVTLTTPANPATGAPASTTQQPNNVSALANLDLAGILLGANSLLNALHGPAAGNGLPIATSFTGLANTLTGGQVPVINGLSTGLGLASSVWGLRSAFQQGSTGGIILSGANVISQFGGAYASSLGYQGFYGTTTYLPGGGVTYSNPVSALDQAALDGQFGAASDAIGAVGDVVPYLGILNSLSHGDYGGGSDLARAQATMPCMSQQLNATNSIAIYDLGTWTTGINGSESSAVNDMDWKMAA